MKVKEYRSKKAGRHDKHANIQSNFHCRSIFKHASKETFQDKLLRVILAEGAKKKPPYLQQRTSNLKLIRMNEVEANAIDWLWYPYIPLGKITAIKDNPVKPRLVQSDAKGEKEFL